MTVQALSAAEALAALASFDAVIDARSPAEYALDHLPRARNWPVLDDTQRAHVGTLYKQSGPFSAKKIGAALVARNIAASLERELGDTPRQWRPLVYCWRGGQRSGALAHVLAQIGFRVHLLAGGYKAARAEIVEQIPVLSERLRFSAICGPTGSGKTRLLQALANQGAQVLDLEALACHRSSVLGAIPGQAQPSQKRFDTLIWEKLGGFDAERVVFVEAESKKVGNLTIPAALMLAMRASPCWRLELDQQQRVALLLEDYPDFVRDVDFFCERLSALQGLRGNAVVSAWQQQARAGEFDTVVSELLTQHYDPGYHASTQRNFKLWAEATIVSPSDHSHGAMSHLARQMLATPQAQ